MSFSSSFYQESAQYLQEKLNGFVPQAAIVLGSGLGDLGSQVADPIVVNYEDIPLFKVSTAPGHAGRLIFGTLGGKRVVVMQGRLHHYEGWSLQEVAYPIRVLRLLGCTKLILTCASGCVNMNWDEGDMMLLTDHIKFFLDSPLRGRNLEEFGPRFPDMTHVYTRDLQVLARTAAKELGLTLREGVYCYFPGPQFETPAEIRAARVLGADAVGMSMVPEAIVAAHCGMEILGLSLLTNMAAGISHTTLSGAEVNRVAEVSQPNFTRLVIKCLEGL